MFRFLMIDDNPADIELIELMLKVSKKLEHEFDSASNLTEGLKKINNGMYDLVLLDLHLPEWSGLDTLSKFMEKAENVPVVVLTGLEDESIGYEAVKLGAQDYLIKGKIELLHRTLKYALERGKLKKYQELSGRIFSILSRENNIDSMVRDILELIKKSIGFDAVGLRLKRGDDYPYFEAIGYTKEYLEKEMSLLNYDDHGNLVMNRSGKLPLSCVCGAVISGEIDPKQHFFTEKGSFYTNSISQLIQDIPSLHWDCKTRETCHAEGFESAAIVPLRSGEGNIGLIQLNSRKKNMLSKDLIQFLEKIAASIGIVLKRLELTQSIKENELKYRSLVEKLNEGIWHLDENGYTIYANSKMSKMLGYTFAEMKDSHLFRFLDQESIEEGKKSLNILESGEENVEVRFKKKDGSPLHTKLSFTRLDEKDGRKGLLAAVMDVTEEKEAEEQIRHAEKMQAIGSLAGGIAHDFNNLLTVIISYSDFVSNSVMDETARQDLLEIKDAARRASGLTAQLLAFSRNKISEPKVINVDAVVSDVGKMITRTISENVELLVSLNAVNGNIMADQTALEQIIINLAVNARDAMQGSGSIFMTTKITDKCQIDCESPNKNKSYVSIKVKDTGTGMDKKTMDRIFEPYFTTKGKGKGTGLGLATVYALVEKYGGRITVESKVGKGTEFRICFPITDGTAENIETTNAKRNEKLKDLNILLVEDEHNLRKIISRSLISRDVNVLEASNGEEAILQCKRSRNIDILLTDIVMPRMGGIELSRIFQKLCPESRIIFITGYSEKPIDSQEIKLPYTIIQKPFSPDELLANIMDLMEK